MNSEGKGKRVLGRLGIPLATSYFMEVLASARTEERRDRGEEGKIYVQKKMVYTLVGLAL